MDFLYFVCNNSLFSKQNTSQCNMKVVDYKIERFNRNPTNFKLVITFSCRLQLIKKLVQIDRKGISKIVTLFGVRPPPPKSLVVRLQNCCALKSVTLGFFLFHFKCDSRK